MRFGVESEGDNAPPTGTSAFWKKQDIQKPCRNAAIIPRRFRAPSSSSSSTTSDDEDSAESDLAVANISRGVRALTSSLTTLQLNTKSRQELLRQVERACERKAVQLVTASQAYQALCETLQRARQDAEIQLQQLNAGSLNFEDDVNVVREQQQLESEAAAKLQQIRAMERAALKQSEYELRAYRQAQEGERRWVAETQKREDAAARREVEFREKALLETEKKKEVAEAQRRKKCETEEAQARDKAQAAKKAANLEEERQREEADKRSAEKEANARVKKYVKEGHDQIRHLVELQRHTTKILDSTDPSVKKIRVQIRREAGACNQIAAAPSAIKNVVSKIQQLLQMAKSSGDAYFKFALDMVASNLFKQVECRADYKSCYPIAHVIKMSCVQNPELTNVMLGYFYKACVFTIPDNPEKLSSQSVAEYKIFVGFQKAVGESSDPDGLEHVTEYTRRMTMISAVLAAVRQTTPWDRSSSPPGLELGDCWSWLARLVNEPPHLMTGALTLTILEVAGFELLRNYKKQFHKLLVLIARDVCPRLSKNAKTGAANAAGQLEMLVNEYHANHCTLSEPDGRRFEETKISEADEEQTDRIEYGNGGGYHAERRGGRGRGNGRRR
ncbi:nucleoporin gle1 [Plasmopara halstedii]|uniref:mRNA export factor GLE1 n=1 Tax=Plasmopara halstedii TaxID=4781 RepID=A0A0P1AZ27_PLAHL|nr:nucleoporin gle1 [Plasmopara halstedii]CEG47718.1 nucleoporin gle1 [Plasmopara halstedii]|eukprot:XP_024584087.1 nucleoporin gle1 [Plasmopara halstedii]